MTDLTELLTRVETATVPDRNLDRRIYAWAYGWSFPLQGAALDGWKIAGGPSYTSSLDAALALVTEMLPGWSWRVAVDSAIAGTSYAGVKAAPRISEVATDWCGRGRTPALALVHALLRALIAKQEVEDAQ